MNVVFIVTRFPTTVPTRGDALRSRMLLTELAPRHDITVAAVVHGRPSAQEERSLTELGVDLEVIPLTLPRTALRLARAWDGPAQLRLFDDARARRQVAALAVDADLVHAQLVRGAVLTPPEVAATVDFVDALSVNYFSRSGAGVRHFAKRREARTLQQAEQELLDRVGAAFVVTDRDKEALGGGANIHVVPNGFHPSRHHPVPVAGRVMFTGNLGYEPNVDAARWLADDIFPIIAADTPGATLRLVGARPAAAVQRLNRRPRVSVAGDVADVGAELATAAVAVAPVVAGSGMQNKVLEAIGAGVPVVTTPQSAADLGLGEEDGIAIAADAPGLAAAAVELLADPGLARQRAATARQVASQRFSWQRAADTIDATWRQVASSPPPGRPT